MSYSQKSKQTSKKTKKTEPPRYGLYENEKDELKEAFDLFDYDKKGQIDAKELVTALKTLGYDSKNPFVYKIVTEFDTPENQRLGGIDWEQFINTLDKKIGDKQTKEGLERIFKNMCNEEGVIDVNSLGKVSRDIGEELTKEEIHDIIDRASSNATDVTFEEFYNIMTKSTLDG